MGKRLRQSLKLLQSIDVYDWADRRIFLMIKNRKCPKILHAFTTRYKPYNEQSDEYIGLATDVELLLHYQINWVTRLLSKPRKYLRVKEMSLLVANSPAITADLVRAKNYFQEALTALYCKKFPRYSKYAHMFELRQGGHIVVRITQEVKPIAQTIGDLKKGYLLPAE